MPRIDFVATSEPEEISFVKKGQLKPPSPHASMDAYSQKSFGRRAIDPAIGIGETLPGLVLSLPNMVETVGRKGIQYGKEALEGTLGPDTEKRADEQAQKAVIPAYKPFSETGKLAHEGIGNAFEWIVNTAGTGIAGIEAIRKKLMSKTPLTDAEFETYKNIGKLIVEGAMAFEGVRGLKNALPKKEEAKVPVPEQQKPIVEQTPINFVETGSIAPPRPQILGEESRAGMSAAENQTGFTGSNRGGGMLPPEEIARIQQEIMTEVTRPDVQGELFSKWRDDAAFGMEPPVRGARDALDRPGEIPERNRQPAVGEMGAEGMGYPYEPMPQRRGGVDRPIDPRERPAEPTGPLLREDLNDFSPGNRIGKIAAEARRARQLDREFGRPTKGPIEPTGLTPGYQGLRRRQGGVIDPDLLTFGVSRLLRESSFNDVMKKFEGTFSKQSIEQALEKFRAGQIDIVFLRPDEFLGLAMKRGQKILEGTTSLGKQYGSPSKRESIRKGLETQEGLSAMPSLTLDKNGRVVAHNGRHRMDVLQEQKMDLIPVMLESPNGRVPTIKGERSFSAATDASKYEIPYPRSARDKTRQDAIFEKHDLFPHTGQQPRPIGQGKRQGGWIGTFEKDVKGNKGLVGTLMDFKKQFNVEKRPLKKVLDDEGIKPETLKDIASEDQGMAGRLDRLWEKGMSNFEIDKTMSILSASKGPIGHIIKWAVDMRRQVTRDKDIRVRERELAMMKPWIGLQKKSMPELIEMKEKWIDNIGGKALERSDFRTEAQWKVFDSIQTVLKEGWEKVNEARKGAGLKPIAYINNYFPAIREGNYWVRVVDSAGETKWAGAAKTIYGAEKIYNTIRRDFEGKEGLTVEKPFLRKKGQYDLADLSAFEETIRVLDRNDPITRSIQARYSKLAASHGLGRTGLHRKGIPGALGFEKGDLGTRNVERVLEHYIRRQEAYMANLKIGKLRSEFAELPKELRDKIPVAEQWINEYFNHSLGMDLSKETMIREIMESLAEDGLGLDRNLPRTFVQELGGAASLLWLTNFKFVLSQTVQPALVIPKIMQMRGIDSSVANPIKAFWDGQRRWFTRDAESKGIVDWATKQGYLDSSISALLDLKATDIRGQRWGAVGAITRWPMAKMEKEMVRGPVLLMFDSALEKSIPVAKSRWEVAAEMTDYYMTHYDRESSPLLYNKLGLIGDAARPLKQYSHNNFGQFFEYAQGLKNRGEVTPLASYMGLQALIGGLKGTILVAEATAIIALYNWAFDTQIPTPEEAMYKYGISDFLIGGGLSHMLGVDVSSSVAAPGMPAMFSLPGLEFGAEVASSVGQYLMKKVKGTESDADTMRALIAVTPKAMHGWIEEAYTQPGGPVPNPRAEMQGKYRRDGMIHSPLLPDVLHEKDAAKFLSLKSLSESKANATSRFAKEILKKDLAQKIDTLDAIVARVVSQEKIDDSLIQRYVAEGGDPKDLAENIKNRLMGRSLTWKEQQQNAKRVTPQQLHKLDVIKQFMDDNQETLTRPETREESNFRKMSEGNIQPQSTMTADDGAEAARKKYVEIDIHKKKLSTNTDFNSIIAEAKRLFPSNPKKQMEFAETIMQRFYNEGAKTRGFSENRKLERRKRVDL